MSIPAKPHPSTPAIARSVPLIPSPNTVHEQEPSLDPEETSSSIPLGSYPAFSSSPAATFRHGFWMRRRTRTRQALIDAGSTPARLRRFCDCGSSAWILRHKSDHDRHRLIANRCHDRFCEACSSERRRLVASNVRCRVPPGRLRLLTLTLKSTPGNLRNHLDRLYRSFRRLRCVPRIRRCLRGGIAFCELTLNTDTRLWHPHLHVIFQGEFLPHELVKKHWQRITVDSYICDVRELKNPDDAAGYVTKYASKALDSKVWHDPERFSEAVNALKGRRLFNTFGNWNGLHLIEPPNDQAEWECVGYLDDVLRRAAAGDVAAAEILRHLRKEPPTDATIPLIPDT